MIPSLFQAVGVKIFSLGSMISEWYRAAAKGEGIPIKNTHTLVGDHIGFAVNRYGRPAGGAAKHFVQGLHAKADPENRFLVVKPLDGLHGDSGVGRIFGAGADEDIVRIKIVNLMKGYFVGTVYQDIEVKGREHLNEIIGK